jgi:hypothetical protein
MQSDVLPYTAYDSMQYETVQQTPDPQGFARRDAPAVQSVQDPPPMPPAPNVGQPTKKVTQKLQQRPEPELQGPDIDLVELAPKKVGADISNYKNVSDLSYILLAVLAVDVIVIFLVRFFPDVFGSSLNRWYDLFGLSAVIADVLIIVIGFVIARYIYTLWVKNKFAEGKWSPAYFTGTLVLTQLLHDILFYYGVITQVPRGHNTMIDVFKDYSSGGPKILAGDAAMMVGSSVIAIALKGMSPHLVASFGLLVAYALPYILYTKPVN